MAGGLSEAELNHILANREPYADATDLIAIRDEIAFIETRLGELTATSLKRMVNRSEIAALQTRRGRYGTAEIVAREHVWANPDKSKVYASEMQHRADAARQEPPAPPSNREVRSKAGFDKDAFVQARKARQAERGKAGVSAGIDDD